MITEVQKNLIGLLKAFGLDKETTVAELALLKTDENRQKMIDAIIQRYEQKGTVTDQDIAKMGMMLTCELKPEYKDRFTPEGDLKEEYKVHSSK
jgi:hypothetical protein